MGNNGANQHNLGQLGLWTFALDALPATQAQEVAAEIEAMGYGTLWVQDAIGRDPLVSATLLLSGTSTLTVGTGIAHIYARDAIAMNAGWQTISEAFPGRFMLGLGVSHRMAVELMRGQEYHPPLATMRAYLDTMDQALYMAASPSVPPQRCLAALGPKMLQLAATRTSGAHSYYVPPEHTAFARETMGPDALLAPEQKVILETDPTTAREIARANITPYLALPNYTNNLMRFGYTTEDIEQCSDRLVDAVVAWGDIEAVTARVRAHRDAGADHVALQVLPHDDLDRIRRDWAQLADALI